MLGLAFDHRTRRVHIVRLAAPKVAVAPDRSHRLSRAQQPRAGQFASVDAISQIDFEPLAPAKVARRRDARAHHLFGPPNHSPPDLVIGCGKLFVGRAQSRIQRHVHVRVDQARNERQAGHVANLVAVRVLVHGDDDPVFYCNGTNAEIVGGDAIPDSRIPIGNPSHARDCIPAARLAVDSISASSDAELRPR